MPTTIGFDVYGTLVDPVEMGKHLEALVGNQAKAFGRLWHDKKVEFAFRRSLMDQYQDFGVCTHQALQYCLQQFGVVLSEQEQHDLISEFSNLAAFKDVIPGLAALKEQGLTLAAFSNGPEASVRKLLGRAGVLSCFDDVISVDDIRTFKPSPKVYKYLMQRTATTVNNCWMISSNPWDVIGAKCAGLKAAWIQRDPAKMFDPWDVKPDLVVSDLIELTKKSIR